MAEETPKKQTYYHSRIENLSDASDTHFGTYNAALDRASLQYGKENIKGFYSRALENVYDAMCDCQCLHPDEEDSDFDDGPVMDLDSAPPMFNDNAAGEGFLTGPEGFDHLTPEGLATMQRLEAMLGGQIQPPGNMEGGDGLPESISNLHLNGHANGVIDNGQFEDAESDEGEN